MELGFTPSRPHSFSPCSVQYTKNYAHAVESSLNRHWKGGSVDGAGFEVPKG